MIYINQTLAARAAEQININYVKRTNTRSK